MAPRGGGKERAKSKPGTNPPQRPRLGQGRFPPVTVPEVETGPGSPPVPGEPPPSEGQQTALDLINETLKTYLGKADPAISGEIWRLIKSGVEDPTQILNRLRQFEPYRAYFPEFALREQMGLVFMEESVILAGRRAMQETARRLTGKTFSEQDLHRIVAGEKSVAEVAADLETYEKVQKYGGVVKSYFEQRIGMSLDDQSLFAFFHPEMDTGELDDVYEQARYSAAPSVFFQNNLLPENLRSTLQNFGISADEALDKYQQLAGQLPTFQRLAAIDDIFGGIGDDNLPTGNDLFNSVPFRTLFKGIMLGDSSALSELQGVLARDTAKNFTQKGGVAGGGQGLLSKDQRRSLTR